MTSLYKGLRPAAGVEALACEVGESESRFQHMYRYGISYNQTVQWKNTYIIFISIAWSVGYITKPVRHIETIPQMNHIYLLRTNVH